MNFIKFSKKQYIIKNFKWGKIKIKELKYILRYIKIIIFINI